MLTERSMSVLDLADLVTWLPAGSAFWMDAGGPAALSHEARELRRLGFLLRVLDFRIRGSKGPKPKPDPEPQWAHEKRQRDAVAARKAQRWLRRQANPRP